ncbi:MAG: tetratricopeptide repeat protein [Ignavibacteriaceae bacterium]|nr:tetratricopeptide repeat protein [Ignavibacteriaceae bacterium]
MNKAYLVTVIVIASILIAGCSPAVEIEVTETAVNRLEDKARLKMAMNYFLDGTNAEAKGDYSSALDYYYSALVLDPSSGIYYSIAKSLYFLSRLNDAVININKAIALDSLEIEYYDLAREIYTVQNRPNSAIEVLNKIIALDSLNIDSYYRLARLYENRYPEKSIEIYYKLLERTGDEFTVLYRIAELYDRLNKKAEAIEIIKKLVLIDPSNTSLRLVLCDYLIEAGNFEEALTEVRAILQLFPDDSQSLRRLAEIYIKQGNFEEATNVTISLFEKGAINYELKINMAVILYENSFKEENLLESAEKIFLLLNEDSLDTFAPVYLSAIELRKNNLEEAGRWMSLVKSKYPADLWLRLGGQFYDERDYNSAIFILVEGVKHYQRNFPINLILGLSYSIKSEYQKSEQFLATAVELNPGDITALSAYGYTLSQLKQTDAAIDYITRALKIDPNNVDLMGTLALIYNSIKIFEKSDSLYSAALELAPENALINNNYAYSLAVRGENLELALEMATHAVTSEPYSSSYLDTKGWVYFKLGDFEKAREYLEKAIEVDENSPVLLEHLGDVLFMLNLKDQAMELWQKALDLNKENQEIKKKIETGEI